MGNAIQVQSALQKVAATPVAGVALVNGTPVILSFTLPSDGQQHRVVIYGAMHVTSALTGGQVKGNFVAPDGAAGQVTLYNGGEAGGVFGSADGGNSQTAVVQAGSTVNVQQTTAVTVGAAVLWSEIWAS